MSPIQYRTHSQVCFVLRLVTTYFFDDYAIITCNYKDGEEKITFEDIENSELGEYIKNKPELGCSDLLADGDPCGNRTHDTTVKG